MNKMDNETKEVTVTHDGICSYLGTIEDGFWRQPELSEWKCQLFGVSNYLLRPYKGDEPNWFWRWMQYLCFGNRWTKNV